MRPFNWTCPHCQSSQTVVDANIDEHEGLYRVGKADEGLSGFSTAAIACQNPTCGKTSIFFHAGPAVASNSGYFASFKPNTNRFYSGLAYPRRGEKPQPDCVPEPLVEDYREACRILDDSPKAAATLIRRCLQGMIRNFSGISKGNLASEINALKRAVEDGSADRAITTETVEAIDHVRGIGNIGAHMEKDINLIVPVDANEAQTLIELVEMLFVEWYVAKDSRQKRLQRIASISAEKAEARKPSTDPN